MASTVCLNHQPLFGTRAWCDLQLSQTKYRNEICINGEMGKILFGSITRVWAEYNDAKFFASG